MDVGRVREALRMPKKIYVVKLTAAERAELEGVVRKGKAAGWKMQRAQALLKFDQGSDGPGWIDQRIADAFGCTRQSVENWRKQAVERGPLSLLKRKARERPPIAPKLDGEKEALLVKLACSQPPEGRARWTMKMLAERLVQLEVVDKIGSEAVRLKLKKTISSRGAK
jgi:transposase